MPQLIGQIESDVAPARRCNRCGAAAGGTRHTRADYVVGYYLLHTGPTSEATIRRGRDDEMPVTYRRLLDVVEFVSCPRCFGEPELRRCLCTLRGPPGAGPTPS